MKILSQKRNSKELLKKAGLKATEILRTKEDIYKTLDVKNSKLSEDELIDLMLQHPDLIQRPLVEKGERGDLVKAPRTDKTSALIMILKSSLPYQEGSSGLKSCKLG